MQIHDIRNICDNYEEEIVMKKMAVLLLLSLIVFIASNTVTLADEIEFEGMLDSIIPDASIWGISADTLQEKYKADYKQCHVDKDEGLFLENVEVSIYHMDIYYVFSEEGLSKIAYILNDSDKRTQSELDQCYRELVEETTKIEGEPDSIKSNSAIWKTENLKIELGKGKLKKYTGSENSTVAIIFKKGNMPKPTKIPIATATPKQSQATEEMSEEIQWKKVLRNPKKYAGQTINRVLRFDQETDTILDEGEKKQVLLCCDIYNDGGDIDIQWIYVVVNEKNIIVDGQLLANDKVEVHGKLMGQLKKYYIASNGYEGEAPIIKADMVTLVDE